MNKRDLLVTLLLSQTICVALGILLPITPSKTGAKHSLAEFFLEYPTYLEEFIFYYLFTNIILLAVLFGFILWIHFSSK